MPLRLAWFTPLPPVPSGIAAYSVELVPLLAATHAVDLVVDARAYDPAQATQPVAGARIYDAHEFLPRHLTNPYDLVVYQMGNAECHDYMWPYLFHVPGLVVLHDGQLHHARGRVLLARQRQDEYREEFRFNHPDADPLAGEFAVAGLEGALYYFWPMLRTVMTSARAVAAHNDWLATQLEQAYPSVPVNRIRMGVADPHARPDTAVHGKREVRREHGIPEEAVVFAAMGAVTPEKRISQILRAVARLRATGRDAWLLLVGSGAAHYDARSEAAERNLADRVVATGFVPDDQVARHVAAADVWLCLRWPSSRETSASWLRCLASGKPTVITDLAHLTDVPCLDPRDWTLRYTGPSTDEGASPDPIAVSIDILDEDHSLFLATRRLFDDGALRIRLGDSARAFWRAHHTLDRMAADYHRVIDCAASRPIPNRLTLPPHLQDDGSAVLHRVLREVGVDRDPFAREARGSARFEAAADTKPRN